MTVVQKDITLYVPFAIVALEVRIGIRAKPWETITAVEIYKVLEHLQRSQYQRLVRVNLPKRAPVRPSRLRNRYM